METDTSRVEELSQTITQIYVFLGLEVSTKGTVRFTAPKTTRYTKDFPKITDDLKGHLFQFHPEVTRRFYDLLSLVGDITAINKAYKKAGDLFLTQMEEEREQAVLSKFSRDFGDVYLDGNFYRWSDLRFITPLNTATKGLINQDMIYDTRSKTLVPTGLLQSGGFANIIELKSVSKKEFDEILKVMSLPVIVIYDPSLPFGPQTPVYKIDPKDKEARKRQLEREGEDICKFNVAGRQEWKSLTPTKRQKPQEFIDFIKHLFPVSEERVEVLKWMYHAQRGRTNFALLLTGAKSVGKGVFYDLVAAIVAADESEAFIAQPSLVYGAFKSALKGSRLCYLDEIDVTASVKTFLKRYLNSSASLEAKGKEVEKNVPIWTNFLISNNNIENNNIDHDERRFLIPQITTTPLLDLWEGREASIQDFKDKIKDPQYIADVMSLVTNTVVKSGGDLSQAPSDPLKTAFFYELVESSLTPWKQAVLSYPSKPHAQIDEFNKVEFGTLSKAVSTLKKGKEREVLRLTSLRTFLDSYRHGPARIKVGYVEGKTSDSASIFYSDDYLNYIGRDQGSSSSISGLI